MKGFNVPSISCVTGLCLSEPALISNDLLVAVKDLAPFQRFRGSIGIAATQALILDLVFPLRL